MTNKIVTKKDGLMCGPISLTCLFPYSNGHTSFTSLYMYKFESMFIHCRISTQYIWPHTYQYHDYHNSTPFPYTCTLYRAIYSNSHVIDKQMLSSSPLHDSNLLLLPNMTVMWQANNGRTGHHTVKSHCHNAMPKINVNRSTSPRNKVRF